MFFSKCKFQNGDNNYAVPEDQIRIPAFFSSILNNLGCVIKFERMHELEDFFELRDSLLAQGIVCF